MSSWIKYLNDPYLVLKIQKYFGVVKARDKSTDNILIRDPDKTLAESADEDAFNRIKAVNGWGRGRTDEPVSSESEADSSDYVITNKLWYFLFVFGTELGDEVFYATFIPFWFWNVDGAVGRRVVMVWAILMYVGYDLNLFIRSVAVLVLLGQGIKDIVCWPRPPSPPVFRLQKKWSLEYGMPSTHAMVGVSIPFSVLLYTMARYQYPVILGFGVAVLWCSVVSVSRLYLGMHSVLDVVCGILLAVVLMVPLIPAVDYLDQHILTSHWSPVFLLAVSISLIIFYPKLSDKWTPTRGDTTVVLSVCTGVHIGAWTNYRLGQMSAPHHPPPYAIIWPSYSMIGLSVLRCAIGFSCIIATRAICKSACYATLSFCLPGNKDHDKKSSGDDRSKGISSLQNTIELTYKYITYILIGFNILYMLPTVFKLLTIDRPTFYTEI